MTKTMPPKRRDGSKAQNAPAYLFCNNDTLRKAMRNLGQLYDEAIATTQLRSTQFSVLIHVDELEEPTMKQLAAALVMDFSALSRAVQPLIRDGYVRLVANPEDGRSKRVTLSKVGERKLVEARELWSKAQARFETLFGPDRACALRETMLMLSSEQFARDFKAPEK